MFDDLNQNNKKVEDIFSGTEAPAKPDILKPREPFPAPPPGALPNGMGSVDKKQGMKKILVFAILIIAVVLIIFGIFWILKKVDSSLSGTPQTVENVESQEVIPDQVSDTPADNPVVTPPSAEEEISPDVASFFPPAEPVVLDSDQDGLTDEEEITLGTDINNIDTDGDGLFDREEAKVYKTNPLLPDTDGDGYSDGDEVKNGYNPLGPGKLYEITN